MDQRFETGTVVGKKSDTHWAQAVKTAHAFGVVEVEDEGGHAQNVGMELVHRLTSDIAEPVTSIQRLFSRIDALWTPNIQTLLLCVPIGNTMTIILRGTGVVYLKRDGHIARLRSREGTISGMVYSGDILFLSSKTCLSGISEDEFFSFFDHMSVEDVAEKLTLHLHKINESVGLFVEVKGGHVRSQEDAPLPIPEIKEKEPEKGIHTPSLLSSLKGSVRRLPRLKGRVRPLVHKLRSVDMRITIVLLILFFISIGVGIVRERSGKRSAEVVKTIEEGRLWS